MRIDYLGPDEDDPSDDCAILVTGQEEYIIFIVEKEDGIHISLHREDVESSSDKRFFVPYPKRDIRN